MQKTNYKSEIYKMYIVIAAATALEVQPLINELGMTKRFPYHEIFILITGIGQVNTTYMLTKKIAHRKPDLILQGGIAGSLDNAIPPGSTVAIKTECCADLGVQENEEWRNTFDLGLEDPDLFPFSNGQLANPFISKWNVTDLEEVNGITVNEIITSRKRIAQVRIKFQAQVESMEGAALHYVCLKEDIPFLQIRSISNYSGERDKRKWKLKEAVATLNTSLIALIGQL